MVMTGPKAEAGRRSPAGEGPAFRSAGAGRVPAETLRDTRLSRFEFKYVIERSLVPQIRDFIRAFCAPDPHAAGTPPEYVVTTLQLDSPDLALFHAIDHEAINRFKLRVRSYSPVESTTLSGRHGPVESTTLSGRHGPVVSTTLSGRHGIKDGDPSYARPASAKKDGRLVMEVKRKIGAAIIKTRARVRRDCWGEELLAPQGAPVEFDTEEEYRGYLDFVRLAAQIGARPVLAVRYTREPYHSTVDRYARVTIDRALCYQLWRQWDFPGDGGKWLSMDSASALRRTRSCVVLELKTLEQVPVWMVDLVQRLDLVRTNFCKYAMALRVESLFQPHLDRFDFS